MIRSLARFRALAVVLAATGAFLPAGVASAETLRLPTDEPVFSFDLPAGWITQQKSPAVFQCVLKGSGGNIGASVETLAKPCSNEEFETILPKVAEGSLKQMGGTDIEAGEPSESNGGILCEINATVQGKPMVVDFFGFTAAAGKSFILQTYYPKDAKAESNAAVAQALLSSVKPIE